MEQRDRAARLGAMGLAALMGVFAQLQEPALQAAWRYGLGVGFGLALIVAGWRWRRVGGLACLGVALLAAGSTGWRARAAVAEVLPLALEGQDITVRGVVANLPRQTATGLSFEFAPEAASLDGETVALPPKLSLAWYGGRGDDAMASVPDVRAGQRWEFVVRLRRPHGNQNPHGFDYELYLFERGIRATGYVRAQRDPAPRLIDAQAGHIVERARQAVRDAISARVSDPRAAGVLAALAVGDQSAIARDDWQLFRDTGVAHLMAISGLHVTMFAWLAALGVAWVWRRVPAAMLWLPAPVAGRWGGLLLALAYAVFAGWGVPAQRTVWMLATVVLLQSAGRRWPSPGVLLAAALVVVAIDPWALLQPGFWLSFAAVGLLMASEPAHRPPRDVAPAGGWAWLHRLRELAWVGVRTQVVATLGLAPLSLMFFQQLSVVGFLANLVAIPLVTLAITPLALLGVLLPPLWTLGAALERGLAAFLAFTARWPGAVWTVPVAPVWAQLSALLGAAVLLMPLPWRVRLLAVPLALPLLWPLPERPAPGEFELLALDVGQGSAVLVRTRHHLLVYDAGPQYNVETDAGERVLLPLLRARGERTIHRLVLSHRDSDHVGGAPALLASGRVRELHGSLEAGHPLRAAGVPFVPCQAGQAWDWDGVRFEVLHPESPVETVPAQANAGSCVLRVSAAQGRALLTGDIERPQELALVAAHAEALRADLLLVPHHGSRTSSSPDLLRAVQPQLAVVQAGYRNRFNHPAPDVMRRLARHEIEVRTSAECGAWRWAPGRSVLEGSCHRQVATRYWHRGADDRQATDSP